MLGRHVRQLRLCVRQLGLQLGHLRGRLVVAVLHLGLVAGHRLAELRLHLGQLVLRVVLQ